MRPNVRLAIGSAVAALLVLLALWGAAVAMSSADSSPSDEVHTLSPGAAEIAMMVASVLMFFVLLWGAFLLVGLAIRWVRQPAPSAQGADEVTTAVP